MMSLSDLELDLETIEELGEKRLDENFRFRAFLKGQDPDKVDRIVHRLNRDVSSRIDCTKCGNCCKKLKPCITKKDVDRLSERLEVSAQKVRDEYVETEEGDQYFKHLPCSFLKDKKCTVYDDRPDGCRSFPHLHKPEFTSRMLGIIQNYSICPIVFNVMEKLKAEFNFR
jgi:Fe-S-cluster containining protein